MRSGEEIVKFYNDFWDKHQALQERQDNDYDQWQVKPYKLDNWSDSVTDTDQRAFANAVLHTLSAAKLIISVHRDDRDQKKESLTERVMFGFLRLVDEQLTARLMPPLQLYLSFMSAVRGFSAGRVLFYDGMPDILPYDPRYLAYGLDSKGVIWSAYSTFREPLSVEFEYGITPKSRKIKLNQGKVVKEVEAAVPVYEWWDDKDNVIVVDEEIINDGKTSHKLERPPVIVVPVGSTPLVVGGDDKYDYISNWGESIYAGGRSLNEPKSKMLSIWMSLMVKAHKPSYFLFTPDGSMKMTSTPWGKGEMLPLPIDAKVQMVEPPDIASSAPQLYQIISEMQQRLYYPNIKYSQLWKGQELSDKMRGGMSEEAERVLNPILNAMGTFYKMALKSLLKQYIKAGEDMTLNGQDSKGRDFLLEARPEELDGGFDLDIEFRSVTPEKEAENAAKGQMYKQSGLVDDNTIREKVMQFQDPDAISVQLHLQEAEILSPKIKMLRIIEDAQRMGKTYTIPDGTQVSEADILKAEFTKMLQAEMAPPPVEGGTTPPNQPKQPPQPQQMGGA